MSQTVLPDPSIEETTLVSEPLARLERSLDQSDDLIMHYLSIRITVKHNDVTRLLNSVFSTTDYICYKHKGVRTKKEHIHVLVPEVSKKQSIRCKLQRLGYKGNESFSSKEFSNGISKGIQYASKENTEPIYVGDFEAIIAAAPKWVQKDMHAYTERTTVDIKKLRDWQLTYTNVVPVTVRYVQDMGLTSLSFFDAIDHLMENTNWRICDKIQRMGIGPFQISDYEKRVGRSVKFDGSWKSNWRV